MDWLTIILAILLPACVLGVIFFFLLRIQNKHAKTTASPGRKALWAGARVISMQQETNTGKVSVGDSPDGDLPDRVRVKLLLRVSGHNGKLYSASTTWLVDPVYLPQIQPGAEISIRVKRNHPETIYPNMPGMEYFPGQ